MGIILAFRITKSTFWFKDINFSLRRKLREDNSLLSSSKDPVSLPKPIHILLLAVFFKELNWIAFE